MSQRAAAEFNALASENREPFSSKPSSNTNWLPENYQRAITETASVATYFSNLAAACLKLGSNFWPQSDTKLQRRRRGGLWFLNPGYQRRDTDNKTGRRPLEAPQIVALDFPHAYGSSSNPPLQNYSDPHQLSLPFIFKEEVNEEPGHAALDPDLCRTNDKKNLKSCKKCRRANYCNVEFLLFYAIRAMGPPNLVGGKHEFLLMVNVDLVPSAFGSKKSKRIAVKNLIPVPLCIVPAEIADIQRRVVEETRPETLLHAIWITTTSVYGPGEEEASRVGLLVVNPLIAKSMSNPFFSLDLYSHSYGLNRRITPDLDFLFEYSFPDTTNLIKPPYAPNQTDYHCSESAQEKLLAMLSKLNALRALIVPSTTRDLPVQLVDLGYREVTTAIMAPSETDLRENSADGGKDGDQRDDPAGCGTTEAEASVALRAKRTKNGGIESEPHKNVYFRYRAAATMPCRLNLQNNESASTIERLFTE
ncbi:hypothetical protein C8F04DRAFT_1301361 [Mycena alexandri]|uniref:Uncharacterized protein n=1 Tax=Mycena alexandri TaxID=1745969 RepID=A0AAD6SDW0_9AGAR|nr:hypothetical protein C8F04DRAFT_1301361 [Mycena alexandri]